MLGIASFTAVSAAGLDSGASWHATVSGHSALTANSLRWCDLPCWIGEVSAVEQCALPGDLKAWDCRQHRLAWLALQESDFRNAVNAAVARHGPDRVGVVLGSSTSGMRSSETAYAHRRAEGRWPDDFSYRRSHSLDTMCAFAAEVLGLAGPMVAVSTACSSSAKVFLTAERLIACGVIDAAVVGGVDSLCLTTLHGFFSLQLLSSAPCRPFDAGRDGISIGEAAGFVLLDRAVASDIRFVGGGESSDAWHMSAPHPDGRGAQDAMRGALSAAALSAHEIGYVNAHGTGTLANDRAEAAALNAVFGERGVAVSSTKGVTGHTLGAAGVTSAIVAMQALERQVLPPSANVLQLDERLGLDVVLEPRAASLRYAMSNSFGFGGNNCSLIFGRIG